MTRREFITLLGGAAATWPLAARAQQPAMPVIGYLNSGSPNEPIVDRFAAAVRQGLAQVGYVEGRNVAIEFRFAEHRSDRLAALATEFARRQVNVIFAGGTQEALAAKSATTTVPIVFSGSSDPVAIGLVASLNRPGGNVTGVTAIGHSLGPKRLEFIRELLPNASKIGVLVSPADPSTDSEVASLKAAAPTVGLQMVEFYASGPSDIEAALSTFDQERVGAFIDGGGPLLSGLRDQTAAAALHHRLPMIGSSRESAAGGAVLGYGASIIDATRQGAIYAGRILKGERPADLPVMQPTKYDLVINLKTAKALGLTVPPSLLAFADEVIE
jgi:putative tryptophan/tyrosine transport system substrate-binding protein